MINVFENLCTYDNRNPYGAHTYMDKDDLQEPRNGCLCDNCFYGRDRLAMRIIELEETVESLMEDVEALASLQR